MLTRRCVLASPLAVIASGSTSQLALVPMPERVTPRDGVFRIGSRTRVQADARTKVAATALARTLNCPLSETRNPRDAVALQINGDVSSFGPEGYRLSVTHEGVSITASTP